MPLGPAAPGCTRASREWRRGPLPPGPPGLGAPFPPGRGAQLEEELGAGEAGAISEGSKAAGTASTEGAIHRVKRTGSWRWPASKAAGEGPCPRPGAAGPGRAGQSPRAKQQHVRQHRPLGCQLQNIGLAQKYPPRGFFFQTGKSAGREGAASGGIGEARPPRAGSWPAAGGAMRCPSGRPSSREGKANSSAAVSSKLQRMEVRRFTRGLLSLKMRGQKGPLCP